MTMSRREFIQSGAAFVGLAAIGASGCGKMDAKDNITIGMFADSHYADKERVNKRYYRESLAKVEQAVKEFNSVKPDFVIELGDYVDKGESLAAEMSYLERIEGEYAKFDGERHYVLGNHDMATFSKEQFITGCGARGNCYSFDKGSFHFVVLDACYNEDESDYNAGNFDWTKTYIPVAEQEWLEADLRATEKKTVVFVHQRLDDDGGAHGVKNAPPVRGIMEQSGKVLAVFQGHDHSGAYNSINGIHYCTLQALVEKSGLENNAYALVQIWLDGSIEIRGFGKQKSRELSALA
jgi:3',5'-cyclic AMP phosphodiesterase CpdA